MRQAVLLGNPDTKRTEYLRQAAARAAVPVLFVDWADYTGWIDNMGDNQEAGYICGEDLLDQCPEGGKILILECPTQNSINDRITGFEKAISSAEAGFEIVDRADTNGEFQKALEITQEMLKEYKDIDVIMCGNDQIAVGATTAVNLAGLKNVIIYGVDGSPDIKKELMKPDTQIAGTAAQSPIGIGKEAA